MSKRFDLFVCFPLFLFLSFCFFFLTTSFFTQTTALGTMDSTADWTFFCELSAFGIQEKTSAAIVAESEIATVWVVPVQSFLSFAETNPQFHVLFYKNITKRLAQMLRGLHSRFLLISFGFFGSLLPSPKKELYTFLLCKGARADNRFTTKLLSFLGPEQ